MGRHVGLTQSGKGRSTHRWKGGSKAKGPQDERRAKGRRVKDERRGGVSGEGADRD
jgi:hypothetical protein